MREKRKHKWWVNLPIALVSFFVGAFIAMVVSGLVDAAMGVRYSSAHASAAAAGTIVGLFYSLRALLDSILGTEHTTFIPAPAPIPTQQQTAPDPPRDLWELWSKPR